MQESPSVFVIFSSMLLFICLLCAYLAPTFIAYKRQHKDKMAICALNVLAGWTGLGWGLALIWSLSSVSSLGKNKNQNIVNVNVGNTDIKLDEKDLIERLNKLEKKEETNKQEKDVENSETNNN